MEKTALAIGQYVDTLILSEDSHLRLYNDVKRSSCGLRSNGCRTKRPGEMEKRVGRNHIFA